MSDDDVFGGLKPPQDPNDDDNVIPFAPPEAYEEYMEGPQAPLPDNWPSPIDWASEEHEANMPRRRWIYARHYIRKYVTVLASAGGIGKSSLTLVEGLSVAADRPLLGEQVIEPTNVWIINLEDPLEETQLRFYAAARHYKLDLEELKGHLFLDGEDTLRMRLAIQNGLGPVWVDERFKDAMMERIKKHEIGLVIVDPFVSSHGVNENDNNQIQSVVEVYRQIARETECAVGLVHHVRKGGTMGGADRANIDSVRGAVSLIGAARAARLANRITKDEADKLGIPETIAPSVFRVDDGKANLAPPVADAIFRRMINVEIANGEQVGVATAFDLPDAFEGLTAEIGNGILSEFNTGVFTKGDLTEYYRLTMRGMKSKDNWAGKIVMKLAAKSEIEAKIILSTWLENGVIEEFDFRSPVNRHYRKGVRGLTRLGDDKAPYSDDFGPDDF